MKKENIIKFYQLYRLYIFPVVVALSSLVLIILIILPQTIKLIDNQRAAGLLQDRAKLLETKVSALESYDQQDLSQKLQLTMTAYPADKDYGNVLGLLQQLINQSGFNIASITLGNVSHKYSESESFEVKLEIKGPQAFLPNLINNLESSSRLIRLNSMDISSNQASNALDISMSLEVLYLNLPKSFGTIDSPLPQLSQKDQKLLDLLSKSPVTFASPSAGQSLQTGKPNPFE